MEKKTLCDLELNGKKVLVRVDYNVPMDAEGNITDDTRMTASLDKIFAGAGCRAFKQAA